jgi:D-serine deaminase-like pyridoxal phosphate-dependent protein
VAAVRLPTSVKGYTSAEMRTFEADDVMEADISKWELDTPALCVDLDLLESNLAKLQQTIVRNGIASRPHAKTHKCPQIARLQLENGAIGICAAKVSEAVVMFEHGVDPILLTTANVTPFKITRAMELRRRCSDFIQATDTAENARDLSEAARAMGIVADVVVDVDSGGHRTGITPGGPALGGTGTYNIDHETRGLTDIQAGSYVFMDAQYLAIGGATDDDEYSDFETSLTILTTVLNAQYQGGVTTDAGAKACTINQPWPIVKGETGMTYRSHSDEFGTLRYDDPSRTYKLGDKLEVIVSHCDPVVNLYDQMYAVRNDRVEAVWRIAARGMSA